VPTTGQTVPNLALVWNVSSDTWGYRVIPATDFAATGIAAPPLGDVEDWDSDPNPWDSDTTAWLDTVFQAIEDSIILAGQDADDNNKLYLGNSGVTHDGQVYNARVAVYGQPITTPRNEKMLRRIWPRINAPVDAEFTLTLFNQRSPMAPLEQVYQTTFFIDPEGVPVTAKVRYMGVVIETQAQVDWDISGFDVEYQERGHF